MSRPTLINGKKNIRYLRELRNAEMTANILHQYEKGVKNMHGLFISRSYATFIWFTCTYRQQDCDVCHEGYDTTGRHSPGGRDVEDDDTVLSCNELAHTLDL